MAKKTKTEAEPGSPEASKTTTKAKKAPAKPAGAPVDLYPMFLTLEETLGMQCNNPDVHAEHISSKAPTDEQAQAEIEALPKEELKKHIEEEQKKVINVFPRNRLGQPIIWAYQGNGHHKEGAKTNIVRKDSAASKCIRSKYSLSEVFNGQVRVIGTILRKFEEDWNVSGKIDKLTEMFSKLKDDISTVAAKYSMKIPYHFPSAGCAKLEKLTRPLRADTMQGPRVSLSTSEKIPARTIVYWWTHLFDGNLEPAIREIYANGVFRGFGQWRSSGKGAYVMCYLTKEEFDTLKSIEADIGEDELAACRANPDGKLTDADKARLNTKRDEFYELLVDTFISHFTAEELVREAARAKAAAEKSAEAGEDASDRDGPVTADEFEPAHEDDAEE